jgi:hypothetical protein
MRQEEPEAKRAGGSYPAPHRVRIPGFTAETEVGLGDVIKRATSLVGIRPCRPCNERAVGLNRWLVFTRYR